MSSTIVLLLFITSLVLAYSAAGLECRIYVSSSDGINNTYCWTGGVQTPCATIDLAIQRTAATDVRDNCSSVTIVYINPTGNDTLEATTTIELQLVNLVNNVSTASRSNIPLSVSTSVSNTLSQNDCPNIKITPINKQILCPAFDLESHCDCDKFVFTASVTDCNGATFDWRNDIHVHACDSISQSDASYNMNIKCKHCDEYDNYNSRCPNYPSYYYELPPCYKHITGDPIELTLNVSTLGELKASTISKINVTLTKFCQLPLTYIDGDCELIIPLCTNQEYCPIFTRYTDPVSYSNVCYDNSSQSYPTCTICPSGYGVSINKISECIQCEEYPINTLVFIGIEIIPITLMVLMVIIFNIQLTNGSINGLVFYSQAMFFTYSNYALVTADYITFNLFAIPCNIFSLDFTPFLGNYLLCIIPNMSPLGAISFWYVIGFYPLFLLLLLYLWITLYDKGYKCVVLVTRPFHCCMARFWNMTGIEPSFTHSIASIYVLCFTQLTGTSFKILCFNYNFYMNDGIFVFFYDSYVQYFHGAHAVAGSFAISVLLIMILLPTLCILLYPFKWFHKLLDCLRLRKQLLISLCDVFTGPFKNGTENTYDYRFFAGLYLLAKIIAFLLEFSFDYDEYYIVPTVQVSIVFLLAIIILVFRPFKRNIHSFTEVMMLIFQMGYFIFVNHDIVSINLPGSSTSFFILNILLFGVILPLYIIHQIIKTIINCINYHKLHNRTVPANIEEQEESQPLVVDDWIADRMENPLEYNEQHVQVPIEDYLPPNIEQPANNDNDTNYIPTTATYGSTNNPTVQQQL
uniref:TRP C-terminal domain-containing protein n=1 Tax=Amphimedon queenslandica TaxID=400682 RepID=A0A1X7TLV6_AMPQE